MITLFTIVTILVSTDCGYTLPFIVTQRHGISCHEITFLASLCRNLSYKTAVCHVHGFPYCLIIENDNKMPI